MLIIFERDSLFLDGHYSIDVVPNLYEACCTEETLDFLEILKLTIYKKMKKCFIVTGSELLENMLFISFVE